MSADRTEMHSRLAGVRRGDLSLGRAAEESGLTQWDLMRPIRAAGLMCPLDADEARRRLGAIARDGET